MKVLHKGIEEEFFDLDKENRIADIRREYEDPGELFDGSAEGKTPRMPMDFIDWVLASFDYIPNKYKLEFHILFDDLDGHNEEELEEICRKTLPWRSSIGSRKRGSRIILR